jgi:membrane-bound lytic murein transglycosylase D
MRRADPHTRTSGRARLRWIPKPLSRIWLVAGLVLQVSCQSPAPVSAPILTQVPAPQTLSALPVSEAAEDTPPPELTPTVSYRLQPDLWRDIRSGFRLDHHPEKKAVQQELNWLRRHPDYLPRMQPRLARFLAYIHQRVNARGMPAELALLPIVESALDPYAFSHGGAAGLWQFIPATGRRFGLNRDWWADGRRDPVAATEAALDYLQYLHKRFGSWSLAIAAYNAGEGNVQRAQRRSAADATFWDLPLPRETRAYLPRLLALATLVEDPTSYQINLPPLPPGIAFGVVDTGSQIDIAIAAKYLGLDLEVLYHWNPALNQWATPPAGPHRLLIPAGNSAVYQAQIAAIPIDAKVNWIRVKVAGGDTLSHIAYRHNTDVPSLRKVNNLRGNNIRVGQSLYIPKSSRALDSYPPARGRRDATYVVRQGDSLWTIGREHSVSVTQLMKSNHVGPKDVLRVGQRLRIPGGTDKVIRTVHYGVRRGDSLSTIAARFNVQITDIASWNQLNVNNHLRPGQSLKLHVDVAAGD